MESTQVSAATVMTYSWLSDRPADHTIPIGSKKLVDTFSSHSENGTLWHYCVINSGRA